MRVDFYLIGINRPDVVQRAENPEGFSSYRKKKISSIRNRSARLLSAAAGIAVEKGLAKFGLKESDISYGLNDYGKPSISGRPDIVFNVSHSGEYAVAAFLDTEEAEGQYLPGSGTGQTEEQHLPGDGTVQTEWLYTIGVDIEQAGRMNSRILSKMKPDTGFDDSKDDMCRRWTATEAFVKCIGKGLQAFDESFHFEKTPSGYMRLCQEIYDGEFSLIEADAPAGYRITCVVRKQEGAVS